MVSVGPLDVPGWSKNARMSARRRVIVYPSERSSCRPVRRPLWKLVVVRVTIFFPSVGSSAW